MKKIVVLVFSLVAVCFSLPAFSINLSFLHNSPVEKYNQDDWNLFNTTSDQVLNSYPDNKKATWKNPKTGHSGFFEVVSTAKKNGLTCRNLKIFNSAGGMTDQYVFTFCKYPTGWMIPGDSV